MIKGKVIKERDYNKPTIAYRKLDALNQSMIKLFDTDPIRFYQEFKLGKPRKDKKSTALAIGDMVDFYLLACRGNEDEFHSRFDEKFALLTTSKGSGQVFTLADILFELTERDRDDETGKIKTSFETRFSEAVLRIQQDGKYKGKDEDKILEDFEKNGFEYFETLCENLGKTVVDTSLVDKALNVGNKLKHDIFTRDIFSGNDMLEYITHVVIVWNEDVGKGKKITCKAEVDMLFIDHEKKIIMPKDLKTTYDNESFDYMYIKNGYYLQNAFYNKAVKEWAKMNDMEDYIVLPMSFVVGDTSMNNRRPLVYHTSEQDVEKGMKGFSLRGNWYRGIEELINEIVWCEEHDMWDCSKETYEKDGQMQLSIKYE